MSGIKGFLVVLRTPEDMRNARQPEYLGVDRVPAYPSTVPEEERAMEEYVFGEFTNETGFIPTLASAVALLNLLTASPRQFEIIYCEEWSGVAASGLGDFRLLGYDVAGAPGDLWSIVGDFPDGDLGVQVYRERLNRYRLFDQATDALQYWKAYRESRLADHDLPLAVLGVYAVHR